MDWQQEFQRWVSSPALTSEQRQDLEKMAEPAAPILAAACISARRAFGA